MRKSRLLHVEVISGDQYPDLATVQAKALPGITSDLAESMRRLLADGFLINDNGRIIPNPAKVKRTADGWQLVKSDV
jgi:hypothetical protein